MLAPCSLTHRLLPSLCVSCLAAGASAQVRDHLVYTLNGDLAGDRYGSAVAFCGDVDRDGCADFIVGAPRVAASGVSSGRARVYSGADARLLWSIDGGAAGDQLGTAVGGAGDVNKDGFADFVVGAPFVDGIGIDSGRARVYSGKDGTILWTFDGVVTKDQLGTSVAGAGDVNGDGHPDVIVGSPKASNNGPASGTARVHSGKDGSVLWAFHGLLSGDELGTSVAGAGDVNQDGHADVIVGGPYFGLNLEGGALVYSGKDGKVLWTFLGSSMFVEFGTCVAGAGDVDKDGYPDLVVGASLDSITFLNSGSVTVFSGKDGRTLHTFTGAQDDHLGWRVAGVGDVDGDGHADVMSGKGWYASTFDPGYTKVWSGRTGSVLRTFEGYQVGGGEDLTGDGVPDLIAGAWSLYAMGGVAWVYSGAALTLASAPHALPGTVGGTQTLRLQAGAQHAGRSYWLLGSISGGKPGFDILGLHFPLNFDQYTVLTSTPLGAPYFIGFQGKLDVAGRATASIAVPSGFPALTFRHAFVVYDASSIYAVSNASPLRVD